MKYYLNLSFDNIKSFIENDFEQFSKANAFFYLVDKCHNRDYKCPNGTLILSSNQIIVCLKDLSLIWKWPYTNVIRFMDKLVDLDIISLSKRPRYCIITFNCRLGNYNIFEYCLDLPLKISSEDIRPDAVDLIKNITEKLSLQYNFEGNFILNTPLLMIYIYNFYFFYMEKDENCLIDLLYFILTHRDYAEKLFSQKIQASFANNADK